MVFFGCAYSMQKFPGQGWNWGTAVTWASDNAKSLATRPPGNSLLEIF